MSELQPFVSARDRGYITREGFYPDAKYQLSVSPHPNLAIPELTYVPFEQSASKLDTMWQWLLRQRQIEEGIATDFSREYYPFLYEPLYPAVFAPTSERLFKEVMVPAIRTHCIESGRMNLAVEEAGYLFPFWSRNELSPIEIVEGPLQRYIQGGLRLPSNIGAIYLDFPSTFNTTVSGIEVARFVKSNPGVLFVVDQANLYFSSYPGLSIDNDLMLTGEGRLTDDDLVLVTNTTTKAMGLSGSATAAATVKARKLLESVLVGQLPLAVGFDEESFLRARQSLALETQPELGDEGSPRDIAAFNYRRLIAQNRGRLTTHLQQRFGIDASSPELSTTGPHIFINAAVLGFGSGKQLCDALYQRFSIATKPASVYTDPQKYPEYEKYVYMAIPWNDEIMEAVQQALDKL